MTTRRAVAQTLGFALLYLVATYAGRLTIMDGTNLSLVWPAAGVGVIWFVAQRCRRWIVVDAVAMALVTMVVNLATGAGPLLAGFFVVANLVQAAVFTYLYRRWLPGLWGSGGTGTISRPQHLWRMVLVSLLATGSGALIGPTGVWIVDGHYSVPAAAVWMARNSSSMLLVGIAGLRLASRRVDWRTAVRNPEGILIMVLSAVAYVGIFGFTKGLPLAFVLLSLTVWAGARMSTTFVVLHDLLFGALAVIFTLHGNGDFANIADHAVRALISQLFVAVVAVVGLAVALGRDERVALQNAAADQAHLFATIIDAMGEGLAVLDADGNFLVRNPASGKLLGGVRSGTGKLADTSYYGIFNTNGTELRTDDLPYQRALATNEPHAMDMLVRNAAVPDGRILAVRATPLPVEIDGRRYAVSVFSDVTAERRHRDELAAFAGVVAHDLSNPLTTVEGWSEEVAEMLGPDDRQAADGMVRISRAAGRMRELITDLLAYTTARDSVLHLAAVDLGELVTGIAAGRMDQSHAMGRPSPSIEVGELPRVHADPAMLRQLFDNLIGNAVKYTAPGTTPRVRVTAVIEDERVRVSIADNGIGIPDGQHAAVFDNFYRAHRGEGFGGTGLGLAICQRIVRRHGGTITAENGPDGIGTTFTFTLPASGLPADAVPGKLVEPLTV